MTQKPAQQHGRGLYGNLPKPTFSTKQLQKAADELAGYCTACGCRHAQVDPDERGATCTRCGKAAVKGAEEIAMEAW